jgi:hypothetical protein
MKRTWKAAQKSTLLAIASLVGVTGCTTYVNHREPPAPVYSPPPPVYPPPAPQPVYVEPATVEVVIRDERDFYEPLSPYGHWEYIGSYGRCWVPARVEANWRPYCNGHWERTDAGWYWVSDEPWGWATYHYGRWDFDARFGWYWIPQTMWAPAWVTWHHGGGYVGWSALPPSARIERSGVIEVNTRAIPERSYVFVEERRFLEPVRPTTVVNNTTIINKTVNITNVKVVNNTVINEGPRTQEIEQASGRKLRPVPARDLRRKMEAPVAASHQPRGSERDVEGTTQKTAPGSGTVAPAPSRTDADADRKAAERARQDKIEADRRAQEEQRKAQAEAERVRVESERQAKIEAERKAQAERARMEGDRRKAETERKTQIEAEQQAQKAQAEAARKKKEADLRAKEQADREARQKQVQLEEARRKQERDHKAQADAKDAAERPAHGNVENKKNESAREAQVQTNRNPTVKGNQEKKKETEAQRRAREQQKAKGKNKKAPEIQPAPPATNAPIPTPQ